MATLTYQILTSNIELVKKTVNYFMAEVANPRLFEEIKRIGIEQSKKMQISNGESFINMGYLSVSDFMMFMSETKQMDGGIPMNTVDVLVHALEEERIVNVLPENFGIQRDRRYKANADFSF